MNSPAKLSFEFEATWPHIAAQAKNLDRVADKPMAAIAYGAGFFQGRAETDYRLEQAARLLRQWVKESGRSNKRKAQATEKFLESLEIRHGLS